MQPLDELPAEPGVANDMQPIQQERRQSLNLRRQKRSEWIPCPFCKGIGRMDHIRVDGPLRIRTYLCDSCLRSWDGSERWAEKPSAGELAAQPRHRAERLHAQPAGLDADRALDLERNRLSRHGTRNGLS